MALSASYTYIRRGNVACPLSIASPATYGSQKVTLEIALGNGTYRGRISSDLASDDCGVFLPDIGLFTVTGTATVVNAVLATLVYHADTTATLENSTQMPTLNASVTLKLAGDGSVAETGVLTLSPQFNARKIATSPISLQTPQTTEQKYVKYDVDAPYVKFSIPYFTQGSVTSYKETWTLTAGLGKILDADIERNAGRWNPGNNTWSVYATRAGLNAFHEAVYFKPATGYSGTGEATVTISDGYDGSTSFKVFFYNSAGSLTVPGSAFSVSEASTTVQITGVSLDGPSFSDDGPEYTVKFIVQGTRPDVSFSTANGGTWNAGTQTFTITGSKAAVNAALASNYMLMTAGGNDVALSVVATSNIGLADTKAINVSIVNVPNAPVVSNLNATHAYTEDTTYNFSPAIFINDNDVGETITATFTLSTAAGSLSATGGTWNSGSRTLTITGDVSTVNSALATMAFQPTANYNSNFTITAQVRDAANTGPNGVLTMNGTAVSDQTSVNGVANRTYVPDGSSNFPFNAISLSSVDGNPSVTVEVFVNNPSAGTWTGVSGASMVGNNYTFTGTISDVNTKLAQIKWNPAQTAAFSVTNATNTLGWTEDTNFPFGSSNKVVINSASVYNSQTHTASIRITDATGVYTNTFTLSPTSYTPGQVTATFTYPTAAGTLSPISGIATQGTSGSNSVYTVSGNYTDVNTVLAGMTFLPNSNYASSFSIAVNIADNSGAGTTGTITMNCTAVADQVSVSIPASGTYDPDGTNFPLTNVVITDPDVETLTAKVWLSDEDAGFFNGAPGGLLIDGKYTFTGTASQLTSAFDTLQFFPTELAAFSVSNLTKSVSFTEGGGYIDFGASGKPQISYGFYSNPVTIHVSIQDNTGTYEHAVEMSPVGYAPTATVRLTSPVGIGLFELPASFGGASASIVDGGSSGGEVDPDLYYMEITGPLSDVNYMLQNRVEATRYNMSLNGNYDQDFVVNVHVTCESEEASGTWSVDVTPVEDPHTAEGLTQTVTFNPRLGYTNTPIPNLHVGDYDTGQILSAKFALNPPECGSYKYTNTSGAVVTVSGADSLTHEISGTADELETMLQTVAFVPSGTPDLARQGNSQSSFQFFGTQNFTGATNPFGAGWFWVSNDLAYSEECSIDVTISDGNPARDQTGVITLVPLAEVKSITAAMIYPKAAGYIKVTTGSVTHADYDATRRITTVVGSTPAVINAALDTAYFEYDLAYTSVTGFTISTQLQFSNGIGPQQSTNNARTLQMMCQYESDQTYSAGVTFAMVPRHHSWISPSSNPYLRNLGGFSTATTKEVTFRAPAAAGTWTAPSTAGVTTTISNVGGETIIKLDARAHAGNTGSLNNNSLANAIIGTQFTPVPGAGAFAITFEAIEANSSPTSGFPASRTVTGTMNMHN